MKKKFAKLIDGRPEILRRIPNIYSYTEEQFEEYALENGYKEYVEEPQPSPHYNPVYEETETQVVEKWEPMDLDIVKQEVLVNIQESLNFQVKQRTEVTCELLEKSIVYDEAALINAMGLEAGDYFICADDSVVQVTDEQIAAIKAALKGFRQQIYAHATEVRAQLAAAQTIEEVEKIVF